MLGWGEFSFRRETGSFQSNSMKFRGTTVGFEPIFLDEKVFKTNSDTRNPVSQSDITSQTSKVGRTVFLCKYDLLFRVSYNLHANDKYIHRSCLRLGTDRRDVMKSEMGQLWQHDYRKRLAVLSKLSRYKKLRFSQSTGAEQIFLDCFGHFI